MILQILPSSPHQPTENLPLLNLTKTRTSPSSHPPAPPKPLYKTQPRHSNQNLIQQDEYRIASSFSTQDCVSVKRPGRFKEKKGNALKKCGGKRKEKKRKEKRRLPRYSNGNGNGNGDGGIASSEIVEVVVVVEIVCK